MLIRLTAFSLVLTASLAAQNRFQIYPERNGSAATYTSRAGGASGQVEILTEVPGAAIAGVGDVSTACEAAGFFAYLVDENPTTAEQLDVVFRNVDALGVQPGTEIARLGPFSTPTLTTTVRSTILFTVTFVTPVALPCEGTWYYGLDLYAVNNWPSTDGHGLFAAWYSPPSNRIVGDNPRVGAPNLAWQVIASVVSPVNPPMTLRMGPIVATPVLSAGGIDPINPRQSPVGSPNYGAGGLYPDIAGVPRRDGVGILVEDVTHAGGLAWSFVSFGLTPFGGLAFGFGGRLWIDPTVLIPLGSMPLDAAGSGAFTMLAPGQIPTSAVGISVFYQSLCVGGASSLPSFSNASGTSL